MLGHFPQSLHPIDCCDWQLRQLVRSCHIESSLCFICSGRVIIRTHPWRAGGQAIPCTALAPLCQCKYIVPFNRLCTHTQLDKNGNEHGPCVCWEESKIAVGHLFVSLPSYIRTISVSVQFRSQSVNSTIHWIPWLCIRSMRPGSTSLLRWLIPSAN